MPRTVECRHKKDRGEGQDLQILKQAAFEQLLLTECSKGSSCCRVFLSRNRCGSVCTSALGSHNEQENARGKRERADRINAGKKAHARGHMIVDAFAKFMC